jgi:hypothetical protein
VLTSLEGNVGVGVVASPATAMLAESAEALEIWIGVNIGVDAGLGAKAGVDVEIGLAVGSAAAIDIAVDACADEAGTASVLNVVRASAGAMYTGEATTAGGDEMNDRGVKPCVGAVKGGELALTDKK